MLLKKLLALLVIFCGIQSTALSKKISRSLSSEQITNLLTTLSSSESTAGRDCLNLLSQIVNEQENLAVGIFLVVNALASGNEALDGKTPIETATDRVKFSLATEKISSSHGNASLVHYAMLYKLIAVFIGNPDAEISRATLNTLLENLFSQLTAAQQADALLVQDKWAATPLHYALLVDDGDDAIFTKTLLNGIKKNKMRIINAADQWGATPVHYAASFEEVGIVEPIFLYMTPQQQYSAIVTKDSRGNAPLHYAAQFENVAIVEPIFLTGITKKQQYEALALQNNQGSTPMHYDALSENFSLLGKRNFLNFSEKQFNSLLTTKNDWGYSPFMLSTLPRDIYGSLQASTLQAINWLSSPAYNSLLLESLPSIFGQDSFYSLLSTYRTSKNSTSALDKKIAKILK